MGKLKILFALVLFMIALIPVSASDIQRCAMCHSKIAENFTKSLHYTNQGMIEKWNLGVGTDFNIPFPQGCLKCHIENCSTCHPVHKAMPNMTVCVECHHKRIGVNYIGYLAGMKVKGPYPDVHYRHNLTCLDCHRIEEIHGDGSTYSMASLAVKVRCEDCHMNASAVVKGMRPKQYDPTITAHSIHGGKVSCYGCHAGWYQACVNCHLEQKKPERTTIEEFYLVEGPDGKLYPACKMFVFYGDKASYAWCLIHPHTITEKGRKCEDCHGGDQDKVFCVNAPGRVIGPPGSGFANPPSRLVVTIPVIGLSLDTELLGKIIIGGVLAGICLHYLKRRITMGGE